MSTAFHKILFLAKAKCSYIHCFSAYNKITRKVLILADNEECVPAQPEPAPQPPKPAPQPHTHTGNHLFLHSMCLQNCFHKMSTAFPKSFNMLYMHHMVRTEWHLSFHSQYLACKYSVLLFIKSFIQ